MNVRYTPQIPAVDWDAVIADAREVTPRQFLDHILGPPAMSREESAERAQAWRECQQAMQAAPSEYWTRQEHLDRCRADYAERLGEIADKYSRAEIWL